MASAVNIYRWGGLVGKKVSALQKHLRKGKRGAAEGGCLLYGIREGRRGVQSV